MSSRQRWASVAIGVLALAVFLGAWKAYVEWFDVSDLLLPPPEKVLSATWDLLGDGRTWHHVRVTLHEILLGFLIAVAAGVVLGALLAEVPVLDRAFTPYLVAFQVLPKIAVIPLLLLWFGFGISSKVAVAAVFGFFPVFAGTRAGIRSVDRGHRDLTATLRANGAQRLLLVELPSALPSILTGLEVGIVLTTIGTIVAEYLAGGEGLGYLATTELTQLRVDSLFGVIVILSVLGFLLHAAVSALRRVLVPWHASATAPTAF